MNFFISWSYLPLLRYSVFYIMKFSINFEKRDVVMGINTGGRVHFWIYLFNRKLFGHETWLTDKNSRGIFFGVYFVLFGGLSPKWSFWFGNLHLIKKQLWWACDFLLFWRNAVRRSKIVNVSYHEITDLIILQIYQNCNQN